MSISFCRVLTLLTICLLSLLCLFTVVCPAPAASESAAPGKATAEEREASYQIIRDVNYTALADYAMLNNPNENFIVLIMPGNVLAMIEPLHEQCVISFMIIGQDQILLLDTCTGILNLREVVDYFAAYPVTVLNSHDHFDHIGGNARFDDV
jgi:glyoxylase-like metal-dependent hydrolase (beta-lactamase superfamily II)